MGRAARKKWHDRAMTLIGKTVREGKEAAAEWRKKFKKDKLDRALRGGR